MECIAVLLYLLLRQIVDLYYEYKRAQLKDPPPPPPVAPSNIGFETTPVYYDDD